jgi:hypothetical protein
MFVAMYFMSIGLDGLCRAEGIIVKNERTATNGLNTKDQIPPTYMRQY